MTTLALFLGLATANLIKPGEGLSSSQHSNSTELPKHTPITYEVWIDHLTPRTWSEMANGELLQTLVAAILFGIATAKAPEPARSNMLGEKFDYFRLNSNT